MSAGWAAWSGVAALVLILCERFIPRFRWWLLCRTLPYFSVVYGSSILRPPGRVKRTWLSFLAWLWPRPYRVFVSEVVGRYWWLEPAGTELPFDPQPAFMEARVYKARRDQKRLLRTWRRPAIRAHRAGFFRQRIRCDNGCGTPYGESPHGFSAGGVLNRWTCTRRDCDLSGEHYCRRCDLVRRGMLDDDPSETQPAHHGELHD